MFSKKIVETDLFMEMSPTAKLLYFYLNMGADDDGFVGNPKTIKMISGATDDDLKILIAKQFIIPFESGVIVIKDWKIHNYIRKDTYSPTVYNYEKSLLESDENGAYLLDKSIPSTERRRKVDAGKVRLGKESLGKERKEYNVEENFIFPDYLSEKTIESIKKGNPKNFNFRIPIAYLNQVTGKNFQFVEKSMNLIKARLKDGFELDDFKKVIDIKFNEWSNTDMAKYIRPETLFGNKFDGYLNQMTLPSKQGSQEYCDDLPF